MKLSGTTNNGIPFRATQLPHGQFRVTLLADQQHSKAAYSKARAEFAKNEKVVSIVVQGANNWGRKLARETGT